MTVSSYGPVFQNSLYIGTNIQNIMYGIELLLYFKTIHVLLMNRGSREKSHIFYALFSSTMLALITIWVATQAVFGEKMWIEQSDYPGGSNAYWLNNASVWYMDWGLTSVVILQLMTDSLMIYRCWIIWNGHRIVLIPIILWFVTLALGVLLDGVTCMPGGNFFAGVTPKIGLAYYSVSMFLNMTLTSMICYRIVRHAKAIQEHFGPEYASLYFSIVAIIVESVLPYTVSCMAFLVTLGIGSPTSVVFMCVYYLMMCISPQMLILRAIKGRALDRDTFKRSCSTLRFSSMDTKKSRLEVDSNTATVQTLPSVFLPDGHEKVGLSQV